MALRFLKFFGIALIMLFITIPTGVAAGTKKNPSKRKMDSSKTVAKKESSKSKKKPKADKNGESEKTEESAKDAKATKPNQKKACRDCPPLPASIAVGSSLTTGLILGTRSRGCKSNQKNCNCPPPRGNPSPGTPKSNPPCP